MSRIGKQPVIVPSGVEVKVGPNGIVSVKGPQGLLTQQINPAISVKVESNKVILQRSSDEKKDKAMHGLYRSLINNMVTGVTQGYKKTLEIIGVGYRAASTGQMLELSLGFSHNIVFVVPPEVKVKAVSEKGKNPVIILESADKQLLGLVASKIRSLREPEPYKGKGIKYVEEVLRRKAGKAAATAAKA